VNASFHLTSRDAEIIQALVQKVRLFGLRQIAEHWWHGELANARRRPVPPLDSPLVNWRPGEPAPDFGQVAYRCRQRWHMRPTRPCTAWIATERGEQLFGGVRRGELKHAMQATHDLGVAAVWLRLKKVAPDCAAAWRSEDLLAHTRRGEKLPDAFVVDRAEQVIAVIEFGGGYDAQRVEAFHQDCMARKLPYQLW
jgi:hypothetical protein